MEQEIFIPGMNSGKSAQNPYQDPASTPYQGDDTLIDGLPYNNAKIQGPTSPVSPSPKRDNVGSDKNDSTPVVGFLYSVSKNGFPEYWPLYVGQNRVGKSLDSDIVLREASVSDRHADIQIKKMRQKGGRLIATIVDAGSKNGIVVNDEELDYDRHPLKNGDIVTIGLNYKFIVVLIDPVDIGLCPAEHFVALETQKSTTQNTQASQPFQEPNGDSTHHPGSESPYSNPYEGYRNQDETINIAEPNFGGLNAGGTRIL